MNSEDNVPPRQPSRRSLLLSGTALGAVSALASTRFVPTAQAQQASAAATPTGGRPNILVIFGDDIGQTNISAYSFGVMGYRTPNIDRIAREGMMFTDYYAENSCTAGRSSFITGQTPKRTGLSKVGVPGATVGLQDRDVTIAQALKPLGYATGQFGKNHLGDKDEFLPTNHGFDEFFGNLYHLNAEEEPENPDYPKNPEFRKRYGPRGVLKATADGKIEDTGPLTKKRMETVDEEFLTSTLDFIDRQHKADKPFFAWFNSTRMHIFTHLKPASQGKTGLGVEADGMVELDGYVGQLLKKLDDLGIADNTIVIFMTDNGAEFFGWPDGGTTIFRGEKNTSWEGGYRSPCMIRWPGVIKPGTIFNDIAANEDLLPTFLAAAGDAGVKEDLLKGKKVGAKTFKVHLDGYNLLPWFKGDAAESPRKEFLYWTDGGDLAALRYENWKALFLEQRAEGFQVWAEPFVQLRLPRITNLRIDPLERAQDEAPGWAHWEVERIFMLVPAQAYVAQWISSFKEFPPRQKPATFSIDQVMEKLSSAGGGAH